MAVSSANVDALTYALTENLVGRLSTPPPNIIKDREDYLLANDFKQLAALDMTISEKYAQILLALSMHQDSVAQAELDLEIKKKAYRSFLIHAMSELNEIDCKYSAVQKSLNRGNTDWKTVQFIESELKQDLVETKVTVIAEQANAKENLAPCTGATMLPSRPLINREFKSEYTKALFGIGNISVDSKEKDLGLPKSQVVIVPVIHDEFVHERSVVKSLNANNERPEHIVRDMAASGSLDGSIMDHGPILDQTSDCLQPMEPPNFDDSDVGEELFHPRIKTLENRPWFQSEASSALCMEKQTPSGKMLPSQVKTPLSSISLCRKPIRPQFQSEIGRKLFEDEQKYDVKEPETKQKETTSIGFSSILPKRPVRPQMKSEAARYLLGDL